MNVQKILVGVALVALFGAYWYWPSSGTEEKQTATGAKSEVSTESKKTVPATVKTATTATLSQIQFCPKFITGVELGARDAAQLPEWMHGDVGNLQVFLARKYGLDEKIFVDGIFGPNTEKYLLRYQKENTIPQTGVLSAETQQKILSFCLEGMKANGTEYPKQSFTLTTGSVTATLQVHEATQDAQGTLLNGAFRIELISTTGGIAKVRVTGRAIGGLQSQSFSLAKGAKRVTTHWPLGLVVEITALNSSQATLLMSLQPTD